jgi:hypothetical protein
MGEFNQQDMLIPRIFLVQKTSKVVETGVAKPGQIISDLESNVLGGDQKPVEIVPLLHRKVWRDKVQGEDGLGRPYPYTEQNKGLPWKEIVDGKEVEHNLCFNWYVLLAAELNEKANVPVPYEVSFMRTSSLAGRKLGTMVVKSWQYGKAPHSITYLLSSIKRTNKKGQTFFAFGIQKGRELEGAFLKQAEEAVKMLESISFKETTQDDEVPF